MHPRMASDATTPSSTSCNELQFSSKKCRRGPVGLVLRQKNLAARVIEQHPLGRRRLAFDQPVLSNLSAIVLVYQQDPAIVRPVMRRAHREPIANRRDAFRKAIIDD